MDKENVTRVDYNWGFSNENGEECSYYEVGYKGVQKIKYYEPTGTDNQHFCDVFSDNGTTERVFNINRVVWKSESEGQQ